MQEKGEKNKEISFFPREGGREERNEEERKGGKEEGRKEERNHMFKGINFTESYFTVLRESFGLKYSQRPMT